MSPPDAAGGALRAQDSRTGDDVGPPTTRWSPADGAVAYWRLGEASGTTVTDSRGTNTGTYVGAPQKGVDRRARR